MIYEGIFDNDGEGVDRFVKFTQLIKKLTSKRHFLDALKDIVKLIEEDGAQEIKYMEPNNNYVRIMEAIDDDTQEKFIIINFFIYSRNKQWENFIIRYDNKIGEPIKLNSTQNWERSFVRLERNFITVLDMRIYTLPDSWLEFVELIKNRL